MVPCRALPFTQAFIFILHEWAQEILDDSALAGFDLRSPSHPGREVDGFLFQANGRVIEP